MSASCVPWEPGHAPATWAEVQWPDWVPQVWRDQIEDFWGPKSGRKPQDYESGMKYTGWSVPAFGHVGWFRELGGDKFVHGRYIHAWNNIGRLVDDNGNPQYVSSTIHEPPPPPPPKWTGVAPPISRIGARS